jgi:hypothetical protein
MGDHGHHDPGGHELEAINTKLLFRLMISLSLVTLLAAIAVVQWFYSQRRELEGRYAAEASFKLVEYKSQMSADLEGIERVTQDMLASPELLKAPPAPPGWIHPDDLVGGGTPADQADEPDEPIEVHHGEPAGDEPAGDEPAGDEPAGDEPAGDEPAEPAGDEPAGDEPTGDEPAGDEPAQPAQPADAD